MTTSEPAPPFPPLYVWSGGNPHAGTPEWQIEDVPGVSDVELLVAAIGDGRLGSLLPPKLAISPHRSPGPTGFRAIDVPRLLREYQIPHRRCYQLLLDSDESPAEESPE